ncbi:MAG: DNA polymerase/3'-5' exonuclease PolX [Gemmatimonadaceae bacterium]
MEPRAAAAILSEVATLLELRGERADKSRALRDAARALLQDSDTATDGPDAPLSGRTVLQGLDASTTAILREIDESGDSDTLHVLRETTPEGFFDMLRVPGLGTKRIREIHAGLGLETLHELELAAKDGRLAALPRFGARAAERILRGIAYLRESGQPTLYPHARAEAGALVDALRAWQGVSRVELAGSLRRSCEVIGDIDVVVAAESPAEVSARLSSLPGVRDAMSTGHHAVSLRFEDGTRADVYCVDIARFPVALWRATGSAEHCADVLADAQSLTMVGDQLRDADGRTVPIDSEGALYHAFGLQFTPPELREGMGEVDAARAGALPALIEAHDIRGVLHCHSQYSDGTTTIEQLAQGARARGWTYLGITDHSQSSFYAGGLSPDAVLRQHEEIDRLNDALDGIRILKGIEADILPDGTVDYDNALLDRFDYVIASVHSRFAMDETQMTDRVVRAMDDPHVTILGHPTGRLLLTREPYAIDMETVLRHAAAVGVAVELNADPHRLDLDWRWLRVAQRVGATIEIGPDAHSLDGLDHMQIGIGIARKGWLSPANVLNARDVAGVLSFAGARRGVTPGPAASGGAR